MKKRGLSQVFLEALKSGLLQPLLNRVKKDDTLMLSIRDGYINIYYRGGNILEITETQGSFDLFFDINYDLSEGHKSYEALDLPKKINNIIQTKKVVSSVAALKELMDFHISKIPQMEREFQQLVERENNRSSISGETEYFITDIEYADKEIGAKFDILAVKWPASVRKVGNKCKASFIEMKYGDGAVDGKAGLIKHIEDINKFLSNKEKYLSLLEIMTTQFNQLDELGLIKFNHSKKKINVELNPSDTDKPEFILLLANHNPRGDKLKNILLDPKFTKFVTSENFDLRFFVSSDAGYALHNNNMIPYEKYIKRFE